MGVLGFDLVSSEARFGLSARGAFGQPIAPRALAAWVFRTAIFV